MKRSSILYITIALISIETLYSFYALNKIHHFVDVVIPPKYIIVSFLSYVFFTLFSLINLLIVIPTSGFKVKFKEHLYDNFGEKHYSILYTHHFGIFAAICFYSDSWAFFVLSTICSFIWCWVRSHQNDLADEYEMQRKKEEAKTKKVVVLD